MKWIIATQPTTTDEKPFKWWWFLTYKTIYPSTSDIINLENEKDRKGTMVPNIHQRQNRRIYSQLYHNNGGIFCFFFF